MSSWQIILIAAALLVAALAVTGSAPRGSARPQVPADRPPTMFAPGLMPHTVQLGTHCQQNPAGFWVSRTSAQAVRRPWCLACLQELDRGSYEVIPVDSAPRGQGPGPLPAPGRLPTPIPWHALGWWPRTRSARPKTRAVGRPGRPTRRSS
jgi:hypothetical protein